MESKKSGYKVLIVSVIIVAFIAGVLLYLRPMELSDLVNEDQQISITWNEIGIRNGEPYIDSESYNDVTEEQKLNMIELFQQYTYKRSLATPFSDGSLSELGEELIYVFVYEDSELVNSVCISDVDTMSVNDRTYVVRNASGLIQDILHIIDN